MTIFTHIFMKSVSIFLWIILNVYFKATQHVFLTFRLKKKMKQRDLCEISLSIWHSGEHSLREVSQDTLWHLKQSVEVSGFDTSSHKVQNIAMKCNTLYLLITCLFISVICLQSGGISSWNVQNWLCHSSKNPPWNIHVKSSYAVKLLFVNL